MSTDPHRVGGDSMDAVFGALSDPTRRHVIATLLREGTTTVPALTAELPITRQAIAKHLAVLADAGLLRGERGGGRQVSYRLVPGALDDTARWLDATETAWDGRLARLRERAEDGRP